MVRLAWAISFSGPRVWDEGGLPHKGLHSSFRGAVSPRKGRLHVLRSLLSCHDAPAYWFSEHPSWVGLRTLKFLSLWVKSWGCPVSPAGLVAGTGIVNTRQEGSRPVGALECRHLGTTSTRHGICSVFCVNRYRGRYRIGSAWGNFLHSVKRPLVDSA